MNLAKLRIRATLAIIMFFISACSDSENSGIPALGNVEANDNTRETALSFELVRPNT